MSRPIVRSVFVYIKPYLGDVMYRIFCITESSYIKHFQRYHVDIDYEDDKRVVTRYKAPVTPVLILPGSGYTIYSDKADLPSSTVSDPWSDRHTAYVYEISTFLLVQQVKDFVNRWFSPTFCCVYKEGQFHVDHPTRYANPESFELPIECFEVHSVDETGSIIGIAPLCDFTPSKR